MSTLEDFIEQIERALELPAGSLPTDLRDHLLDLTRDVAHGVTRIAGPLTTYLLGVAVGRGADRTSSIAAVAEVARSWQGASEADGHSGPGGKK